MLKRQYKTKIDGLDTQNNLIIAAVNTRELDETTTILNELNIQAIKFKELNPILDYVPV